MTTVNRTKNHEEFELKEFARPIDEVKKKREAEAAFAHLSAMMEEVLESIPTDKAGSSKIVHPDFKQGNGPSDSDMLKAYVALIGDLAEQMANKAIYGNTIAKDNADVGKALLNQMQTQFKETMKKLDEIEKQQEHASFWSKFTKWIEGIAAAIGMVIATLCGQPALALVIFTFTTLSLSGGMDKITKGIADLISKDLVKLGYSKEEADKIAKVIADVLVIAVTIVATVVTCGAGAAGAATEVVEAGAEAAVVEVGEEAQSSAQKLLTFLSESNPFAKLSAATNFSILTGSMAIGSTSFFSDVMEAACHKMAESEAKESFKTAMSILLGILTSLVGAGAGIGIAAAPEAESALNNAFKSVATKIKELLEIQEFNLATALKTLMAIQIASTVAQVTGQVATGAVDVELANTTKEQGQIQAFLSLLQSLNRMDDQQSATNAKAQATDMKTSASDIATLSERLNDLGKAVARELQA